jgi:hypothetical protein
MLFVHIFIMAVEQMYRISRLYPQVSRGTQAMTAFCSLRLLVSQSVTVIKQDFSSQISSA